MPNLPVTEPMENDFRMFMDLTGKVTIVTGAARGIGQAIAERFCEAGATVVVADLDGAAAQTEADRLSSLGYSASSLQVNLVEPGAADAMVADTVSRHGRLDILVNNAGIAGKAAGICDQTDDDWQRVIDLDLTAVFTCCRAGVRQMTAQGTGGAIVNIASISGKEGNPNMIPYSVSKAGVICLTKALAKEVTGQGIRVNAVAPAVIRTPILDQLTPEQVNYMTSRIPMGRTGTCDEVAAVVHFLASDEASFVTGQTYDVSGGRATY